MPYVPQQNGRVERKHRHPLEMSRALRFQANLPKKLWGECLLTTTFLISRLLVKILSWKTPYEILYGHVPDYSGLRSFGCLCYAYNINLNRDKFDSRARKCMFLGYPPGQKAYKLYDMTTHVIFVSRDLIFFEKSFPYHTTKPTFPTYHPNLVSFHTK